MAARRQGQPAAPLEGRSWWLDLQRHHAQGAGLDEYQVAAEEPESTCAGAQMGEATARRRAALLSTSQTLLRRMRRPQPCGSSGSSPCDSACGTPSSGSSVSAGPPAAAPTAACEAAVDAPAAPVAAAAAAAAAPPPAVYSTASRTGEGPAASDMQQMNRLLEGGLIGRAMAASAAWHQTKAALQQQELEEWRLMRGEGPGCRPRALGSAALGGAAMAAGRGSRTAAAAATTGGGVAAAGTAQHAHQLLPPLDEERQLALLEQDLEAARDESCCAGLPSGTPCHQQLLHCAAAEALIAAFADAEVREYLQQQLAVMGPPRSGCRSSGSTPAVMASAVPTPTAGKPACEAAATAPLSCCPAGLGPAPLPPAAVGCGGGHATSSSGRTQDPVLAAWMVTRCPPDLPVRGYEAPPTRTACRLVAAQEMRSFYKREQWRQGSFFKWSGLTPEQASGRGSGGAPMRLAPEPARAPAPHRTLKGLVRRNLMLKHVGDMAQQSKATVWAQQHAQQMEAEAGQRLQRQQADVAAAHNARLVAAAAAARRAQLGTKAGDGLAAVVQQAKQAQAGQPQLATAGSGSAGACTCGSPGTAQGGKALPALQLQKLTEHWHRTAAAAAAAGGELTARQRQELAARERLRQQWAAVQGRLPDVSS